TAYARMPCVYWAVAPGGGATGAFRRNAVSASTIPRTPPTMSPVSCATCILESAHLIGSTQLNPICAGGLKYHAIAFGASQPARNSPSAAKVRVIHSTRYERPLVSMRGVLAREGWRVHRVSRILFPEGDDHSSSPAVAGGVMATGYRSSHFAWASSVEHRRFAFSGLPGSHQASHLGPPNHVNSAGRFTV